MYDLEREVDRVGRHANALNRRFHVLGALPEKARIGDKLAPTRVDIAPVGEKLDPRQARDVDIAVERTLEAMATGVRLITNPVLEEGPLRVELDLLVRMDSGRGVDESMVYAPVVITSHSIARRAKRPSSANCRVTDLPGLSLSEPVPVGWRHRTAAVEAQKLAFAHTILSRWGVAAREVGQIGTLGSDIHTTHPSRLRVVFFPGAAVMQGMALAFAAYAQPSVAAGRYVGPLDRPARVKECGTCEFHNHCRLQLLDRLDISLVLPGDKATPARHRGLNSLPELAASEPGSGVTPETIARADAWLDGRAALRRPYQHWVRNPLLWGGNDFHLPARGEKVMGPALEKLVEIDIDMEAHPSRGTFLWGVFDGENYTAFTDYSPEGDDGRHVAEFWAYLQARRAEAEEQGKRLRVWVYAETGENHWLRYHANRHGGRRYPASSGVGAGGEQRPTVVMPTIEEVEVFLASDTWCDVFKLVRHALLPTESLSLKTIAPLAGFEFSQEGIDGRAAITLFEQAVGSNGDAALQARRTVERYNADDCLASRSVRHWLRDGAPGLKEIGDDADGRAGHSA